MATINYLSAIISVNNTKLAINQNADEYRITMLN